MDFGKRVIGISFWLRIGKTSTRATKIGGGDKMDTAKDVAVIATLIFIIWGTYRTYKYFLS